MDKKTLNFILQDGEGFRIEFKEGTRGIDKDIVAFANAEGGRIFLGVTDNGEVKGIRVTNTLKSQIQSIARNCDPSIAVNLEKFNKILIIHVPEGGDKPYKCKEGFYIRVGASSQKLSRDEIVDFIMGEGKVRFDEQICKKATLRDIDEEKLSWFLEKVKVERRLDIKPKIEKKEALKKLTLLENGKLSNASLLLFGKKPQKFFLQAELRCARFKGIDVTSPFTDMKVFNGNIIDQREKAIQFIKDHISLHAEIKGTERIERWEYPIEALREAVTNAICHRDYSSSGNIQIRIFDDRTEIWNPGGLPEGLSVEDLKREHESKPRNKLIAKMFFLIKFIEQWGTGTNRMIDEVRKHDLPDPIFKDKTRSFIVIFRKSILTDEILKMLNERQRKILEYLKENKKITNKGYRKIFNVAKDTAHRDINKLIEMGMILRGGMGRNTFYQLADENRTKIGRKSDENRTKIG